MKKITGFSIIEIAISMIIIGILSMGILKAKDMIYMAKISATMNQINQIILTDENDQIDDIKPVIGGKFVIKEINDGIENIKGKFLIIEDQRFSGKDLKKCFSKFNLCGGLPIYFVNSNKSIYNKNDVEDNTYYLIYAPFL